MSGFGPQEQEFAGMSGGSDAGSQWGAGLAGASTVGLGITAAMGGMDMGLASLIGTGVGFLAPVIGAAFDEAAEPVYRTAESPILQLPSSSMNPFAAQEGIMVMGQDQGLASKYGVQDPMGFFE